MTVGRLAPNRGPRLFSEVIGHLVSQSPGQNCGKYGVEVDWRRDHGERRATGDKVAQDPATDRGQTRQNECAEDVVVLPAREKDARNGERDGTDDIEEVEPRSLHGDGEQHGHGVVPEDHVVFPGSFQLLQASIEGLDVPRRGGFFAEHHVDVRGKDGNFMLTYLSLHAGPPSHGRDNQTVGDEGVDLSLEQPRKVGVVRVGVKDAVGIGRIEGKSLDLRTIEKAADQTNPHPGSGQRGQKFPHIGGGQPVLIRAPRDEHIRFGAVGMGKPGILLPLRRLVSTGGDVPFPAPYLLLVLHPVYLLIGNSAPCFGEDARDDLDI